MEDRFTAIRFAIAAALPRDVVVIAGKGAEEFQEYCEEDMVVKVHDSACCPQQPNDMFRGAVDWQGCVTHRRAWHASPV